MYAFDTKTIKEESVAGFIQVTPTMIKAIQYKHKRSPQFEEYTYESSKVTHPHHLYSWIMYMFTQISEQGPIILSFSHITAVQYLLYSREYTKWCIYTRQSSSGIDLGDALETTNYRINCSIIIVVSSTTKQVQVAVRVYSRGSTQVDRSGRSGRLLRKLLKHWIWN